MNRKLNLHQDLFGIGSLTVALITGIILSFSVVYTKGHLIYIIILIILMGLPSIKILYDSILITSIFSWLLFASTSDAMSSVAHLNIVLLVFTICIICGSLDSHKLRRFFGIGFIVSGTLVLGSISYLFYSVFGTLKNLYGVNFPINEGWILKFDDIVALTGLCVFFLTQIFYEKKDSLRLIILLFILLLLSIWLGSRSLLIYIIVILLFSAIKYKFELGVIAIAIFILLISVFIIFNIRIQYLTDLPALGRLMMDIEVENEEYGRLLLYQEFFLNFKLDYLFGGSSIEIGDIVSEGVSSFHSLPLDAFWYSGLYSIVPLYIFVLLFRKMIQKCAAYDKLNVCFIFIGLLFALPPFSNPFAFTVGCSILMRKYMSTNKEDCPLQSGSPK